MFKIFYFVYNILDKKQKSKCKYLCVLSFFAMIFETLSVVSVMPLISSLLNSSNFLVENIKKHTDFDSLTIILILFLIVALAFTFKLIFLIYYTRVKTLFIENVKVDQSNKLFQYYLSQPFIFHVNNNSSQLIRNLNEAQSLGFVVRTTAETLLEILILAGLTLFLFFVQPKVTITCIVIFITFSWIFYNLINKHAQKWGELRQKFAGLKIQELQQGFGSIRDIKVLNKQNFFLKSFSNKNFNESFNNYKNSFYSALPRILFEWVTIISALALLFYVSLNSRIEIFLPILAAFALAAYRMVPSVTRILHANQTLQYWFPIVKPYIEKSKENYDKDFSSIKFKNFSNKKETRKFSANFKTLKFDNISFKFEKSKDYILNNINVEVKQNDFIGIFGKSGSGKTTLINLLIGLYKPNKGNIFCGGNEIHSDVNSWRKLLSFIPQNIYIIDDTIRNNIAYGNDIEIQDENRIISSLKKSNAYEFVSTLKNKLDTKCGELGELFSGGQRQRLAIARAFYNNAEVFIFDEFTNFLDEKNEDEIMREISRMKNKTRIIVSHNKKVLDYCEKIYEIRNKSLEIIK